MTRPGTNAQRARFPRGVLFDLDGTLLDSAPDMLATVNRMRAARGKAPMVLAALRPHVSRGARAMAAAAFPDVSPEQVPELVPEFLALYREELGRHGTPFAGVEPLLAALLAAILFDERFGVSGIVGGSMILLAALLAGVTRSRAIAEETAAESSASP